MPQVYVSGNTTGIFSSNGRVGFTVGRTSGFTTGSFRIFYNTPFPNSNYIITLQAFSPGLAFLGANTSTSVLEILVRGSSGLALRDCDFYFTVA